jgi:sigma-B regulation protein RsbQ
MNARTSAADGGVIQRNNVRVTGHGPKPMVFGHGFGTDQSVWRLVAPEFEDRFEVVRFDYVGSGRRRAASTGADRYGSLLGYAEDLLEVCAALDLRGVTFVAHSVSGMIGILASLARPSLFERLVLLTSSARYLDDPPDYIGGFAQAEVEELLLMMEHNFLGWAQTFSGVAAKDPELSQELFEKFSALEPSAARRFARVTFFADVRAELPRVTVPSLILHCQDDDIVPASAGEYLRDHLPGSSYRVLPLAGHCPQISAPQLICAEMNRYLAAPPSSRRPRD